MISSCKFRNESFFLTEVRATDGRATAMGGGGGEDVEATLFRGRVERRRGVTIASSAG